MTSQSRTFELNPKALQGLIILAIVDNYEKIIKRLSEPPITIGHSFGGLFVQLLLNRGLGKAGVGISPAQPSGIKVLKPSTVP
jgi:non-heme chloroperoxidase